MAALSFLVRFIHLVGMVVLLGGAAFVWYSLRTGHVPHWLVVQYEWAFWRTLGVMFVTGVGNMGALRAPPPTTRWGRLLTAKLAVVTVFVVGSFLRTVVVLQWSDRARIPDDTTETLRRGYALTAGVLLLVVALAEVLAHG